MASSLGSLVVHLGLDAAEFVEGLNRSQFAAQKAVRQMQADIDGAVSLLKGLGAGVAGALSVGALVNFTRAAIDSIDALNDTADATGSTIEAVSALEAVGLRTGTSIDTVTGSLVKFNSVLSDSKPGTEAAEILKRLGLSAAELKAQDPSEALRRTAVAFAKFADDGNKARAMQELFGKSVKEVAPFLKDLAEQERLVGTTSAEAAAEAEKFNKSLAVLSTNATLLTRDLAGPLVTSINKTVEAFREGKKQGESFFQTLRREQLKLVGIDIGLPNTGGAEGTFGEPDRPSLGGGRPRNEGGGGVDWELIEENRKRAEEAKRFAEQGARAAQSYIDGLNRQLQATKDLTVAEAVLADIRAGRAGIVTSRQQQDALAIAAQIDAANRLAIAEKERERRVIESNQAVQASYEQAQAAMRSVEAPIERLNRELIEINKLAAENPFLQGETKLRLEAEAWKRLADSTKVAATELDIFSKNAAENIQAAFGDGLVDIMNGNFKNIGDGFVQMLNRMAAEALAADLARKLFGADAKGGVSGTGGLFGSILGGIGSWFGFGGVPGMAGGGIAQPGGLYQVAENRPEMLDVNGRQFLLMGNQRGKIDPNPKVGQQRSTVNNVTINVPQTTSRATGSQLAADFQRRLAMGQRNL